MDLREIEQRLEKVLRSRPWPLPQQQITDMIELVQAGEPGVALENFCTQLEEYDVPIPPEVLHELRILASAMGLHPRQLSDNSHC